MVFSCEQAMDSIAASVMQKRAVIFMDNGENTGFAGGVH